MLRIQQANRDSSLSILTVLVRVERRYVKVATRLRLRLDFVTVSLDDLAGQAEERKIISFDVVTTIGSTYRNRFENKTDNEEYPYLCLSTISNFRALIRPLLGNFTTSRMDVETFKGSKLIES